MWRSYYLLLLWVWSLPDPKALSFSFNEQGLQKHLGGYCEHCVLRPYTHFDGSRFCLLDVLCLPDSLCPPMAKWKSRVHENRGCGPQSQEGGTIILELGCTGVTCQGCWLERGAQQVSASAAGAQMAGGLALRLHLGVQLPLPRGETCDFVLNGQHRKP